MRTVPELEPLRRIHVLCTENQLLVEADRLPQAFNRKTLIDSVNPFQVLVNQLNRCNLEDVVGNNRIMPAVSATVS